MRVRPTTEIVRGWAEGVRGEAATGRRAGKLAAGSISAVSCVSTSSKSFPARPDSQ